MPDPETAPELVVDLGPDCPIERRDHVWIVVPLRAIAVVAPRPGQADDANVLQQAVLGFLGGGVRDPQQLGRLLGLRSELVEMVLAELRANAWIGDLGAPTEAGRRALREPTAPLDYVQLWAFQEPWSAQLLPRFADDLSPAQVVGGDKETVKVVTGPVGNPHPATAFRVRPRAVDYRPVDRVQLATAYAAFEDHLGRRAAYDGGHCEAAVSSRRIVPIAGRERDVLALTFCFTSDRLPHAREWDVADPTGLWWLSALSESIRGDRTRGMRSPIRVLQNKRERPPADVEREQRCERLGAEVRQRGLPPAVDPDALVDALAGVNEAVIAARESRGLLATALAADGRDRDEFARRFAGLIDEAIGRGRALAEEVLRQSRVASGARPAALRFALLEAEREAYGSAARMIGFGELPDVFVIRGRRRVATSPDAAPVGGALPELILGNLAQAASDERHLLRALAQRRPDLLRDLAPLVADETWLDRLDVDLVAAAAEEEGSEACLRRLADDGDAALRMLEELAAIIAVGEPIAVAEDPDD